MAAGPIRAGDRMSAGGVPDARRTVVLHEDDVGMCHGANSAFLELSRLGACSSGSVMVPCPWFLEIAEVAAAEPGLDLGIHLTLNAEKRHYKWRPLTAPSQAAGLTDENGYFWPTVRALRAAAHPDAVEAELRAQIEAGPRAGIDITHLDAHMGAALAPEFIDVMIRLGLDFRLPIMVPPPSPPMRRTTISTASTRRHSGPASSGPVRPDSGSSTPCCRPPGAAPRASRPSRPIATSSRACRTG